MTDGTAPALLTKALALHQQGRLAEAATFYRDILLREPNDANALHLLGALELHRQNPIAAVALIDRAITIHPKAAPFHSNRGLALQDLNRLDEALVSYNRALAINPNHAEALNNRGNVLQMLKRYEEALASYDRALAIKPGLPFLLGRHLHCKMLVCDWRGLGEDFSRLGNAIDAGEKTSSPFSALIAPLSAAQQRTCSEDYVAGKYPRKSVFPPFEPRDGKERIRLGYFSADFRDHPVSQLIAGLPEHHDRNRFDVMAFSLGAPSKDAMRRRLDSGFDRVIEAGALPDQDIAALARRHKIDIAIDLNGFTAGNRTGVFALGAAPIQVNYLGYPGTMGAKYFDYIIADSMLIPSDQRQHYAEKIAYLPNSYQPRDTKHAIAERKFSRVECGLPESGFVFCSFNNSYKFTPEVFAVWMRLLNRVEGSVLWLPHSNDAAMRNLRSEAQARGVSPQRLVFAPRLADFSEHLARLGLADLFLDTRPFNAHTSASDALWAGLPVLTCLGETFAGRVAASLLRAAGLPELVTHNLGEYEARARELASNDQKLEMLRQRLRTTRSTAPLFDTALYTKYLEAAFVAMWQRYLARMEPEDVHIARQPA